MDKRILQTYSTWAKENLENQIEVSLKALGINDEKNIKKAKKVGDVTTIEGDPTSYPADLYGKRENIINLIIRNGYKNVIEEFAYTWFNRFVALKFMEVHGFLTHGFRVLSDPAGGIEPEILKNLNLVKDDLRLDMALCNEYKQQGKIEELFRHVLIKQCNVLAGILPMLFSSDMGYLELLLPNNLLKGETVITRLNDIPEEAFLEDVEIIGWMYQFYVSDKRQAYRDAKLVTKELIPTLTQVFTTDWIVRYMADNSVGRLWLESYPNSSLRSEMKYFIEDAEQTLEVQKRIDEIKYKNVNPEEIRIIEPCCGSGHILVYVFDLLYKMYEERGYQKRDIPTLILNNNLVGLDVDKRAAQLASFSLIMKARSVNNRFFNDQYYETPHVYELQDSKLLKELEYRKQLKDLNLLNDEEIKLITYLVDTFENGKTIGSLLKVTPIDFACLDGALDKISKKAVSNLFNIDFLNYGVKRLRNLSTLAKVMSSKYDVMVTNPPYLSSAKLEGKTKEYLVKEYPESKTDMFAMFMDVPYVKKYGFRAIVNPDSWMFLGSFEKLRDKLVHTISIVNMVHLGLGAFDAVVQTTAFVLRNCPEVLNGVYFRVIDAKDKEAAFLSGKPYISNREGYTAIPGTPVAYWLSNEMRNGFNNKILYDVARPRQGMATTNNDLFLRLWFETELNKIGFGYTTSDEALKSKRKWFPVTKGGPFRRWYGNFEYIVNYENGGKTICDYIDNTPGVKVKSNGRVINRDLYFCKGLTWSSLSSSLFSMRYVPSGFIFETKGSMCFAPDKILKYLLGLYNSVVIQKYLEVVSPTLDYHEGPLGKTPVIIKQSEQIDDCVDENIDICKSEWDSFETSWDYVEHPLVRWSKELCDATAIGATMHHYYGGHPEVKSPVELCFMLWQGECKERFEKLKANEEELNRIFIDIYGLQNELTPEVEDKDVTVRLANRERDIRSLISYLVGVAMGRYSLDVPGLAFAGGDWDTSKYTTFQPDDDGIIPIYNGIGMEDGLTTILINLIKQIYGEDTYRQNIDFIAEALGKNNNESSEETLNRYLNDGFYADHLKMYQKRPIYWLFTSGKKAGFKCLIYMHRYNEDTLARINAKYFLPESTRKKNELDELNGRIAHAEGRDKLRYEKERQNLAAAYNEAIEYGQILDHMANQYISIDLDDGVKVNYAKFQGVEIVTDGGSKVKKDLLAPLK